jgi:hypothetical protein
LFKLTHLFSGSWVITTMKIVRYLLKSLVRASGGSFNPCTCCLAYCAKFLIAKLEDILKYLIRNAYIIIARDGTPFVESGKMASHLIMNNLMSVISLNYIGDFILVLGEIYIVCVSGFVGYQMLVSSKFYDILNKSKKNSSLLGRTTGIRFGCSSTHRWRIHFIVHCSLLRVRL